MKEKMVNIDFEKVEKTFPAFVREKAVKAGSNIVYMENGQIIKENPVTFQKTVIESFDLIPIS